MATLEELLAKLQLEKYAEKFKAEEIDLRTASKLSEEELKDLGLPLGARKKLYEALHSAGGGSSATAAAPVSPAASKSAPGGSPAGGPSPATSQFVPADPAVAQKDSTIPLEGRKSIRDNAAHFADFTARLKKALGNEYYFSFDYGAIVAAVNAALKQPKPDSGMSVSEDYPKRIGQILHGVKDTASSSYLAEIVEHLEQFARDEMNREAFREKTPARAIVIQSGTVTGQDDPNKAHKQSFTDGALVITYNSMKLWTNIERIARPYDLQQML